MSQRLVNGARGMNGLKITLRLPQFDMPQRLVKGHRGMNGSKITLRSLQSATNPTPKSRWGFKQTKKPWEGLPTSLNSLSDIEAYLSKPSWSVKSLLKDKEWSSGNLPEITPKTLSHLLNLSALPQPKDEKQEQDMLATLRLQLHFVREIQDVDTTDVKPLSAIREETEEAREEMTIGLDSLREALAKEETTGRMRRPRRTVVEAVEEDGHSAWRRREGKIISDGGIEWAPLSLASNTHGLYYVVENGREAAPNTDSRSQEITDSEQRVKEIWRAVRDKTFVGPRRVVGTNRVGGSPGDWSIWSRKDTLMKERASGDRPSNTQ